MHEELNELRKALRNQEELHARTRSELEASRPLPQQGSQQTSSMPISSRTTESGWECIGEDRVPSFPVGTEVRSPEICTPSQRSPSNREKVNFDHGNHHTHGRGKCTRAFCAACFFKNVSTQVDAKAVHDEQLRDLLDTLGMTRRSSSSSSGTSIRDARIKQLEDEYIAQMVELRLEVQKAQKAEQRLRTDRDEWRLMAGSLQPKERENDKEDDDGDEEEEADPDAGEEQW